jgi:hypothetical protein
MPVPQGNITSTQTWTLEQQKPEEIEQVEEVKEEE